MSTRQPTYLQRRRRLWYAVLEIPSDLRLMFSGKRRFIRSLGTDSESKAKRDALAVVGGWMRELDRARTRQGVPVSGDAEFFRRALRDATTAEERAGVLEQIDDRAAHLAAIHGDYGQPGSTVPEVQELFAVATGKRVPTLEHLDEWLATLRTIPKTKDMQAADVKRFAAKFPLLRDIDRPAVRRWATSLLNDEGLAPKTVGRIVSAARGYHRYLQSIAAVPDGQDPFANLELARHAKREAPRNARQPFLPADVMRLRQGAAERGDGQL
ncbi:MAG: DUF6538 domain-containing protein, partial [Acetobacteraceae bacterium]